MAWHWTAWNDRIRTGDLTGGGAGRALATRISAGADGDSRGLAAPRPSHDAGAPRLDRGIDAVSLLSCYAFLLMAIPSSLVVGSLGAAGAPAAMLAVALLCWYLVARQHPSLGLDRGRQPVRVAATIFAGVVVASYTSASRHAMPATLQNGADRGLIVVAGWVGVLALAADGIGRDDRLRTLLRRIVMLATAMAAFGLIEFCVGVDLSRYIAIPGLSVHQQVTDLMSRNGLVRVTATTAQPLEFSAVLAMSLPIALHQARFAPAALRVRRWSQVALITVALPMTGSRSAFFGLAVICILLIPTWRRRERHRAYIAGLAVPILAWLIKPSVVSSFGVLFGGLGNDQSSMSRANAYSGSVPYIAAHPWLGQGFQTFDPQTYFFVDNQYLTSLIETGFIGLLALVACFATGWFTARSVRATATDAETRDLGQCLAASIAVGAVCFASFDALSFSIAAGLFFLLLGCVGAAWRLGRARSRPGTGLEG
jgi:polysaccharide biosynthesis protein PslJ